MKQRRLGASEIPASELGYGCMGLTWAYGDVMSQGFDAAAARAVLERAAGIGITLFDTADMYGPFTNEELVGEALAPHRETIVLATKCGIVVHGERTNYDMRRDGTPRHIREACDASLSRLKTDVIDLYQLHRVDPEVPIEESVGAMAELVRAGKVRAIGLSEVDVPTLQRAMSVHPIASVQSEYSLFERNIERAVLPFCEENNIALLAYSPLGRGMLTGRLKAHDITAGDFRATLPRYQGETFEHNRNLVTHVETIARQKGVTAGQVALAWLLQKSANVIPIPGTKHVQYLEENAGAADLTLSEREMLDLDALPAPEGDRYATGAPTRR